MIATLLPGLMAAAYQPPAAPELPDPGHLLLRLALFTAVVLGAAGAAVWVARRRTGPPPQAEGEAPRVVASAPLAGRCALHLLQVGDAHFVAATDAAGLKALHPLPETFAAAVEEALAEPEPSPLLPRRIDPDAPPRPPTRLTG